MAFPSASATQNWLVSPSGSSGSPPGTCPAARWGSSARRRSRGVLLGDEPVEGRVDEAGVAGVEHAVGEGELLGLQREVDGVRRAPAARGEVEALQDVEHLEHDQALGDGPRLVHRDPAVGRRERLVDLRLVRREVGRLVETAVLPGRTHDLGADRPLVERARALLGQDPQRPRQGRPAQPRPLRGGLAVRVERLAALRRLRQVALRTGEGAGQPGGERRALLRQRRSPAPGAWPRERCRSAGGGSSRPAARREWRTTGSPPGAWSGARARCSTRASPGGARRRCR